MNHVFRLICLMVFFVLPLNAYAAANIEIDTPAISGIKRSMQGRHAKLAPYYASGAIGLTRDGLVAMRDANAVPLSGRQSVNSLISQENKDRNALYREIARANNHPEWEKDIRSTFSQRWIKLARSGWWYQAGNGSWAKK